MLCVVFYTGRHGCRRCPASSETAEMESAMAKLRLLKTGHGDLVLAEWDITRPETIAVAESAFAEHCTAGRLAFRLDGPGRTTPIRRFERSAAEILIVPAIQGG
jgi:hypothetical protein